MADDKNQEQKENIKEKIKEAQDTAKAIKNGIEEFDVQEAAQVVNRFYKSVGEFFKMLDEQEGLQDRIKEIDDLQYYLEAELEKDEYKDADITGLFAYMLDERSVYEKDKELFEKALEAARAAKAADAEKGTNKPQTIQFNSKGLTTADYPLDKISSNFYKLLQLADKNGQITFAAEKSGSKKSADIKFSIFFEELPADIKITKELTAFDKLVYIASASLYDCGFNNFTLSQLWYQMGNDSRPSAAQIKKMASSLTKMRSAIIYYDNADEHKLYNKYKHTIYDGSLLPMERITAIANGQITDSAIHLLRKPPLIEIAASHNQITTVPRAILAAPISKTDDNLKISDYLIERIARMSNGKTKSSKKILYKTLFEHCDINTNKKKSRAKEKINKYLDHYVSCNFINGYREAADGILIDL